MVAAEAFLLFSGIKNEKAPQNHFVRSGFEMFGNTEPADLKNIRTDMRDDADERLKKYIEQVGNPYIFKVGETVVTVKFDGEKTFSEVLKNAILAG